MIASVRLGIVIRAAKATEWRSIGFKLLEVMHGRRAWRHDWPEMSRNVPKCHDVFNNNLHKLSVVYDLSEGPMLIPLWSRFLWNSIES